MQLHMIKSKNVSLEVRESGNVSATRMSLVICPGLSEAASEYTDFVSDLFPRHCIVITYRGRGASEVSASARFRLEDHVQDIINVITYFQLDSFTLMGYSRGVSYVLGSLAAGVQPDGILLADYPPEHKQMPYGWSNSFTCNDHFSIQTATAIEKDSEQIFFDDLLKQSNVPLLVMKGEQTGSLLPDPSRYQKARPDAHLVRFEKSGHLLKEMEPTLFRDTTAAFLEQIDHQKGGVCE